MRYTRYPIEFNPEFPIYVLGELTGKISVLPFSGDYKMNQTLQVQDMADVTITGLQNKYLRQYPTVHLIDLRFGLCAIRIQSNSADIIKLLTGEFSDYLAVEQLPDITINIIQSEPPRFAIPLASTALNPSGWRDEYANVGDGRIIRKPHTGTMFLIGKDSNHAVGRMIENPKQITYFIHNRYIQWLLDRGCLLGHGVGISGKNHGVAIAGLSIIGRSSLGLRLLHCGYDFVSTDRILVSQYGRGLQMHGVPRLRQETARRQIRKRLFNDIIPENIHVLIHESLTSVTGTLDGKLNGIIEAVFTEERFRFDAPLDALVILNWVRDGSPIEIDEVDLSKRPDLLSAFFRGTGLFLDPPTARGTFGINNTAYLALLSHCRVFEISGGVDLDGAISFCREILGE